MSCFLLYLEKIIDPTK